jgi:hypothetical protein
MFEELNINTSVIPGREEFSDDFINYRLYSEFYEGY